MIITSDIQKLAELARLKIVPAEQESLCAEIGSILGYVDQIKKATELTTNTLDFLVNSKQAKLYILGLVTAFTETEKEMVAVERTTEYIGLKSFRSLLLVRLDLIFFL